MPGEMERLYAELDRRYGLHLIPRVRLAVVTAAASPISYSITLPGETTARDGVPSVSPIVPQVGDLVRVELVGDQPVIVNTLVRHPPVQGTDSGGCTATSTTYGAPATGSAGPAATLDLVAGQSAVVLLKTRVSGNAITTGARMSFAVSGAETLAGNDDNGMESDTTTGAPGMAPTVYVATVTGSHTFTCVYRVTNVTTGTYDRRRIIVVPC